MERRSGVSESDTDRCVVICAGTGICEKDLSRGIAIANSRAATRCSVDLVLTDPHQAVAARAANGVSVIALASPDDGHWFFCDEQSDAYRIYRTLLSDNCYDNAAELVFVGPAWSALEVVRARRLLGQFRSATVTTLDASQHMVQPGTVSEVFRRWATNYVRGHQDSVLPDAAGTPERISVVIPLYNQGEYLLDAINSVRRESSDAEIVVVNDGSTDPDTNRVFESTTDVQKIRQPNQGLAAARNAGIKLASGDYVVPLDADDMLFPGFLASAQRALAGNPDIAYVVGHARYTGLLDITYVPVGFIPELNLFLHTHGRATAMFRKDALEAVGGYDTEFAAFEDWDLHVAMHRFGFSSDVIPLVSQYYRRHLDSMSFATSNKIRPQLVHQIMRKHLCTLDVDDLRTGMLVLAHLWKTEYEPSTSVALQRRMADH
jgi:hypothetical protein